MAEKKMGRIRRTASLDVEGKQVDQPLRKTENKQQMGKINPPAQKPAVTEENKPEKKTGKRQGKPPEAKPRISQATKSRRADEKQPKRQETALKAQTEKQKPAQNSAKAKPAQPAQKQQRESSRRGRKQPKQTLPSVKAYFLGGLNEIGKNFTLYECNNDMVIVDCGLAFPAESMLGVDIVIPDFAFVEKCVDRIRGIVITHGHEDHIGAIPYLLRRINVPIYGTALTIGLIESKLKEHNLLSSAKLHATPAGSQIKLGCMTAELIHVNHSIADAVSIALHTPAGTIIHTGDFKIDFTPAEGEMINLGRFAELGKNGVLALFADSTNAERPGYTQTEQMVNNSLDTLFAKADGKRIIIATFASNISRVQQIINCAVKYGRKVALSGRSMVNVMGIASNLGYLDIPEGVLIDLNMINRYDGGEIVLITTGSQGETMSALTRMAFADHRQVELSENDFIIISARPIPGNEKTVGAVVDELLRRNCTVIYESMYDVHVSGHACQEELKIMHALCKPKYFIPVHGEQKHLRKHAALAVSLGMSPSNIFIGEVGNTLEINDAFLRQGTDVNAGSVMVDGLGVGDIGSIVLRDRKHLGEDGIIIVVCTLDSATKKIASGPDIVSRGFVYVRESEKLMDEARQLVYNTFEACAKDGVKDWNGIKQNIREELSRFLYKQTRRSPMVLPILMEV